MTAPRPRLGFVGLGWIGAMRMSAVAESGRAEVKALCDPNPKRLANARESLVGSTDDVPHAPACFHDHDELLDAAADLALDGIVIATPNALHRPQALTALERGLAVFCQKPLALDADSVGKLTEAARRADRLLGVDYSYRYVDGVQHMRRLIEEGSVGSIMTVESVFHNAYGPDKDWCYDPALAGGGALMDLGVHQIDLPLWLLGFPAVADVDGRAFRDGRPLAAGTAIDDFAEARLTLDNGTALHVTVSWNAHAGADCVYRVAVYGTEAGLELRNIDGSFYDFELVRFEGRSSETLARDTGDWLGGAILDWVDRLARDGSYDPSVESSRAIAEVVDRLYDPLVVTGDRLDASTVHAEG